ncbi:MmgE/PrpD family protein [Chloroflexota bacterium]
MNETRELAQFAEELKYEDLPREVIDKTKNLILDLLGSQLATSTMPWNKVIYEYVKDWGDGADSTIVYYGDKTKVENAAFANATFGHGFEIDDVHYLSMSHPGCVVIPAALALGEKELITGKELILAVVLGYEVMCRVGRSVAPSCGLRGFHPTSVPGPFGAAAAAGKILGFDTEGMLNALGIAGSHCAGIMAYGQGGGSVKRVHAGIASQGGLRAALLAQRGITGPPIVLEAEHGFCKAFSDEYSLEKITANLGKEFIVPEVSYKPYCCCGAIHAPIEAVSKITKEHRIEPDKIEEIFVGTNRVAIHHVGIIREPKDVLGAQFSLPFSLALTLIKGSNSLKDYSEENLKDAELLSLAGKVRIEIDKEANTVYPLKRGDLVTIKLKNGTSYQERVYYPKGWPENPMTKEELEDKFRGLASVVLPEDRVEEIIKVVNRLEDVGEVCTLMGLLIR